MKKSLIFAALAALALGACAKGGGKCDKWKDLTAEQKECVKAYKDKNCSKTECKEGRKDCMKKAFKECGVKKPAEKSEKKA